jgi:hypothetical protein
MFFAFNEDRLLRTSPLHLTMHIFTKLGIFEALAVCHKSSTLFPDARIQTAASIARRSVNPFH